MEYQNFGMCMNEKQPIINKFIPQNRTAEGLGDYFKKYLILILVLLSLAIQVFGQSQLLDEFKTNDGWKIYKSDSVEIKISTSDGYKGKCIHVDYNLTKGFGYERFRFNGHIVDLIAEPTEKTCKITMQSNGELILKVIHSGKEKSFQIVRRENVLSF